MSGPMPHPLPAAHPLPAPGQLLLPPRAQAANQALLLQQPGLSLSYNARGALLEAGSELADDSARTEVLVPGFHCPSGIIPLLQAGLKPVFYRVGRDLGLDHQDLLAKVGPRTRAVLVIHFFGFEYDLAPLQALRAQGIALIEDWSHSFLRSDPLRLPRPQGDYQVFSFWKLVPCGVGGGLRRLGAPDARPWPRPRPPRREALVRFKRDLEEALAHSPHRRSHAAFQTLERWRLGRGAVVPSAADQAPAPARGEDHYPFDPVLARAALPPLARRLLLGADLAAVAARRRANYLAYARLLPRDARLRPLRPELDEATCPWVYPVLLQDRDRIDRQWRAAGVALHTFGIWLHSALAREADRATREDAEFLARELLCLAVHQDLSPADIERSSALVASLLGRSGDR